MSPEAPRPPARRPGDAEPEGRRPEAARAGPRAPAPEVGKYLGLGLTWALSTLLFLWLGTLVDGWLGTTPALTLVGAFVGAGGGFYHMVRQLRDSSGRDGARRR